MPANVITLAPAFDRAASTVLPILTLGPADPTPENIILYPWQAAPDAAPVTITLSLDGIADSWPRFDQVAQAVIWYQDGHKYTGTFSTGGGVYPAIIDVDQGVQYGPTGTDFTGTLEQPAQADVKAGVQYGGDGTEFTGTLSAGGSGMSRSRVANA